VVQHSIYPFQPHRYDRQPQPRGHHRHALLKRMDLASFRAVPLWKDENRDPGRRELADVPQRVARAWFRSRERKRVEEKRGEVVEPTKYQPFHDTMTLRKEMRVEELLAHRHRYSAPPSTRQAEKYRGCVKVALMVRGKDDWAANRFEMLAAFDAGP
jgi:hypothetical protein